MKQNDAVQKAVQWLFNPVTLLYGNIHDCFGLEDHSLVDRLRFILQKDYDVSYYDASIISPKDDDNSLDKAQIEYRPMDEACCNVQKLIDELIQQSAKAKCIIVNLAYICPDRSRESFLRQIPKVIAQEIGHNRLIIIGDEADLPWVVNAKSGIRTVKLKLPSSEYMRRYLAEKISNRLSTVQVDTLVRYCRERHQMEARDVVNYLQQNGFTKESYLNATQMLKEDCKEDEVMNVSFADVIGLDKAKDVIRRRVILPRENKELFIELFHTKPSGAVLLYGPPGTGKTLFANAVANELHSVFYNMSLSSVLGKYLGDSEKYIRDIFDDARRQESATIFIDELDALACDRSDDTPTMTRIKTELLTQIQASSDRVLIIGATNRLEYIDRAFTRSGRFGLKICVGLPGRNQRIDILKKKLRDRGGSDIDFDKLADRTKGYNCADIQAVHEEAVINAVLRFENHGVLSDDSMVRREILMEDYNKALEEIKSTVSEDDHKRYDPDD